MFAETFAEQGCLVIDQLFDTALIDRIRDECECQYNSFDVENLPMHMKVGEGRLHLPVQLRGPLLETSLYANPLLMEIISSILHTPFLIDNVSCVTALPGAEYQRFHRDHPALFAEQNGLAATLPAFAITLAIPLIDLDPMTGTTKLFAGSVAGSRDANGGERAFSAEICPYVQRGGCFLMDYRLWHHGTANRSDRNRPILYIVFAREWFTDVVNFAEHSRILIDAAALRQIPTEYRQMFRRVAASGLHDLTIKEMMRS